MFSFFCLLNFSILIHNTNEASKQACNLEGNGRIGWLFKINRNQKLGLHGTNNGYMDGSIDLYSEFCFGVTLLMVVSIVVD